MSEGATGPTGRAFLPWKDSKWPPTNQTTS